ncbi:AEC family transporter [Mycoplasmatota bacterium]|nr:AEC family transporter [Mycoplasmatota bacterium]
MNITEIIVKTLGDPKMLAAVSSSILIILLGFYLRKKEIFDPKTSKILSKVVLMVAIPALAYKAFMVDINKESLSNGINVLIWGFIIYILLIFVSKLFYVKYEGSKKEVLEVLTVFGSTTFFGIPIVGAFYGAEGVMYASIFNIAYRVFLYSFGYIKLTGIQISKENAKKMFINPIIIATFLGIFVWMFQGYLPQVKVNGASYAFARIDQTATWLYQPMVYLARLCSPLAWLAIGTKLAEISLKQAVESKASWHYSIMKVIAVPTINILLLILLTVTGILPLSFVAVATVIIMMATPTATVAAAFAISADKEALLTSNSSLLSTVVSVICMPIWIIILEIIKNANIF